MKSDLSALRKLSENLKRIEPQQEIPITHILSDSFIQSKTPFSSLNDLFEKGGFNVETKEDLEAIPDEDLNSFISENSEYSTFKEMISAAGAIYMKNMLLK